MFTFLLVVQAIVAAGLVTVILMQRSEGGGLGMGGSPSGLMSARGAADFLTRMTTILASAFVLLSVALAVIASSHRTQTIDTSLARGAPATQQSAPLQGGQQDAAPFQGAAAAAAAENGTAPVDNSAVPLQR